MQSIFEYFIERFSQSLQIQMHELIEEQDEANPNDKLQKGVVLSLENVMRNKGEYGDKEIFELASLSCYLTLKMKADENYLKLLKEVNHPYIQIFVAYFEEDPSNYLESLMKIEKLTELIEKREDYSDEMRANVLDIHSWVYGQQSDIAKVKEIFRYTRNQITETENPVEQFGLQECYMNCSWWFLHSGVEIDFDELFSFIDPYVQKFKFYKTLTSYLNVKGGVESFMGDNQEAIKSFEELIKVHEEYNDDYRLSIAIGNLAEVHMVMGKSNLAKDMMEKAINLYKESTGKWPYLYLTELGNMYYLLGDEKAEESFLHAYEIQRKEKSLHKAFIMYELIHYYLRIENLAEAKKYLKELRSLSKELEAPSINARVDYLRGFLEMLNHNLSNAVEYLQSALEQAKHTRDIELILFCNIQLSVAYLWYYRLLENKESLNLALSYIDTVRQLAIENNHNQILTSSLMICAVLCSVNGEYEKSLEDIKKARQVGKDIDFETLKRDLDKIENSIQNARNTGQLEIAGQNIIEYILPQFKSLLSLKLLQTKRKDVEVLGLLIISDSGIPIFSKLKDKLKANDLLLSGLLMAITQLAESILEGREIGRLKDVNYADFCITLQAIKNGIVAVIASEVSSETRMWAMALAERIKEIPRVVTKFVSDVPSKIEDLLEEVNL
ncbi:MAG: tetratricopeptide repeat protein [Candidatus Heimdallarchaeota archaeon]|nr:tetratricopeptide repeat protein [Candidatus Heimdallarchaeota archaeon]